MIDYVIMFGILAFLLFLLVFGSKYISCSNDSFFDLHNSKAMRGFWCLIIMLVHIPQAYQNIIQDMIGSFAYIGVTFFFMTSAYGLSQATHKKPESIHKFWMTRLPKLMLPNWLSNIFFELLFFILYGSNIRIGNLLHIHSWVQWLLACYLAFWCGYRFCRNPKYCRFIVYILVLTLSVSAFYLRYTGNVQATTWHSELFGFIWGMLLFAQYDNIKKFVLHKWFPKTLVVCLLALLLGVLYLLYKPVVFWGNYVLKVFLGLSILCFILILNGRIKIGNKISWLLGDISYEVYLIHGFVFQLIANAIPNINSGGFILISMILTVFFATIIHKMCMMLLNKLK